MITAGIKEVLWRLKTGKHHGVTGCQTEGLSDKYIKKRLKQLLNNILEDQRYPTEWKNGDDTETRKM